VRCSGGSATPHSHHGQPLRYTLRKRRGSSSTRISLATAKRPAARCQHDSFRGDLCNLGCILTSNLSCTAYLVSRAPGILILLSRLCLGTTRWQSARSKSSFGIGSAFEGTVNRRPRRAVLRGRL
jgi:hypothetical protein